MKNTDDPTAVNALVSPGHLSLTTVRWITETEAQDEDGDTVIEESAMFDVTGGKFRVEAVNAASEYLVDERLFLPPHFLIIPDNENAYDENAVGVHAVCGDSAYHVGFLPRTQAPIFRTGMAALDRAGQGLEVLGCFSQGKASQHPNPRIYLPENFAELIAQGYATDPANHPTWLGDPTPVIPRPYQGWHARGFSDEELCKIYCWYARRNRWFCFPNNCEGAAAGFRSYRGTIPDAMDTFVLEPNVGSGSAQGPDDSNAKLAAKEHLRSYLSKDMDSSTVDELLANVYFGGTILGWEGEVFRISFHHRKDQRGFSGSMTVAKVSTKQEDYIVDALMFDRTADRHADEPNQRKPMASKEPLRQAAPEKRIPTADAIVSSFRAILGEDLDSLYTHLFDCSERSKDPAEALEALDDPMNTLDALTKMLERGDVPLSTFIPTVLQAMDGLEERLAECESRSKMGLAKRLVKSAKKWAGTFS